MERLKKSIFWIPALCIFVLASCAVRTPVPQVSVSAVAQNLKYKNIIFKKFTAIHAQANVPATGALLECKSTAIAYLNEKDIFKRVEELKGLQSEFQSGNPYDEPTLLVEADLTFLRIVNTAARMFGGVFCGRSAMKMDVKLTDASTGEVIVQQKLEGAPNAYSSCWSMGSADQTLPVKMGYLLGDFIIANVSNK